VSRRAYNVDLTRCHKLIVGEGESDRNFFAAFCPVNSIDGFEYAFTGMHNDKYSPSGFDSFRHYLPALYNVAGFSSLTDLVLICDSTDKPSQRLTALKTQIRNVNRQLGGQVYAEQVDANVISTTGSPRVHVLMIPAGRPGGIESVCFDVARDNLDASGHNGTVKEGWVNTFANSACVDWATEKRDKLRRRP
jgi:hypothetical protein